MLHNTNIEDKMEDLGTLPNGTHLYRKKTQLVDMHIIVMNVGVCVGFGIPL